MDFSTGYGEPIREREIFRLARVGTNHWITLCKINGADKKTAEVWDFGYRRMPSAKKLRDEMRLVLYEDRERKKKDGFVSPPPCNPNIGCAIICGVRANKDKQRKEPDDEDNWQEDSE
ncbi:MAG: hypothetical protein ACI4CE_07405 [Methanomethylophilus alvi]